MTDDLRRHTPETLRAIAAGLRGVGTLVRQSQPTSGLADKLDAHADAWERSLENEKRLREELFVLRAENKRFRIALEAWNSGKFP